MEGISIASTVDEFEIEEHVAKTNRFFQQTHLTLADLDVYSAPLTRVKNALFRESITDQEAFDLLKQARRDREAIDADLDEMSTREFIAARTENAA